MEKAPIKTRPRRKLPKSEVVDILERNVSLFKGEENFIQYVVELAIYLLEYEYDWSDSQVDPPERIAPPEPVPRLPQKSVQEPGHQNILAKINPTARMVQPRACPHCGSEVGAKTICPACRNLTS